MKEQPTLFETTEIRRIYDEKSEEWLFSVIDIIRALTQQEDYQAVRNYWKVLKNRLKSEGNEPVTNCNQLKMRAADGKTRLTEAELIFTALAELSTRQIAETMQAKGLNENSKASKTGGNIAKNARVALEEKTGKKVISQDNFLRSNNILEEK